MRYAIVSVLLTVAGGALAAENPKFDTEGRLLFPENYREWIFLSSGLGMTYGPAAAAAGRSPLFDNVFVNPEAYAEFKKTGRWPEETMFVLEIRKAVSEGSINRGGHFQTEVAAVEASVKDTRRFPKGWAYFGFGGGRTPLAKAVAPLGPNTSCQGCHSANGAVDNTFTQFYPAAFAIAVSKATVRPEYKAANSLP